MALTITKLKTPAPIGNGMKLGLFSVAFDNSYPTGGEALDLTDYFEYVHQVNVGGNDTVADNGYLFQAVLPGASTEITSSNLLLTAYYASADAGAFTQVPNTTDLSAVGALTITVIGA